MDVLSRIRMCRLADGIHALASGLAFVFASACVHAGSAQNEVERFLEKEAFKPHLVQMSSGEMGGDQSFHLALAIDARSVVFAYLLEEVPGDRLQLIERAELGSTGARPVWRVEIARKSAFISAATSSGCCMHGNVKYQFRLNDARRLVLIGYDEINQGSNDGRTFFEDGLSLNLLTGDAISSHAESSKSDWRADRPVSHGAWRTFKLLPPIKTTTDRLRVRVDRQWWLGSINGYDEDFSRWLASAIDGSRK